ncbi:hypothetical protein IV203_012141 [Nitzschia inconspicua]|uniref:Uncharacterized protein n=1 Tax=Nitzschia inconspicua TaxID=303405 RepID=A0A9K3PLM8_9STRA|nr:hypothetical protein IV203_012141 [Nitzschia inconspicua]
MSSIDISIHHGLREEINKLKKRIIELETAEADKEKLRNDLANVKRQMNEEKSRMELDFMNQVSAISQANALKVEEIETQLMESHAINRALSEQLEKISGLEKKMQNMEIQQEKEIARIVDSKIEEIDEVRHELDVVKHSKDELAVKLGEAQTRVEMERKKVQELNTSLEELNRSFLNESQAEKAKVDTMEVQLLNAERENERLRNELKVAAARDEMQDESDQQEIVHVLREKLRERDCELNSKIEEIRRLESIQNENKVQLLSIRDLEQSNIFLKKELEKATEARNNNESIICRLESKNRQITQNYTSLQKENKHLLANLNESMKHGSLNQMAENHNAFAKLQSEYRALKEAQSKLEEENNDLKSALRKETSKRLSIDTTRPLENASGEGNRTSKIIKQLEENLKREGENKQAAASAIKKKNVGEKMNDIKIQSLTAELNSIKLQLDSERDISKKLRKELRELKDQRVQTRHSSSAISHVVKGKVDESESRAAVKGIVNTIEQRLGAKESSNTDSVPIRRLMEHVEEFPGLKGDLQEMRKELSYERQQVVELEEELTRQCEINCALLKEISNLSCENDAARNASLQTFSIANGQKYGDEQQEIDRLIMEVASAKSKLFNAEQSKANLEERYLSQNERHKKEIDALKEQLVFAEKAARNITSRMDESSTLDRKEIESLQKKLKESKAELSSSKDLLAGLHRKSIQQTEIQNAKIEALQAELANSERSRETLALEKQRLSEENGELKKSNKRLEEKNAGQQAQFDFLQNTVNEKVQQFEQLHGDQKEEINRLRDQVTSLEQELSQALDKADQLQATLEEKENMESTVDELARKNVQALHAQINQLQKQLTTQQLQVSETEIETKRKVKALEEALDVAQMEMEESLRDKEKEIEELRGAIENKDRKASLLEKEKEQLVLSMNDMMKSRRHEIDDLQKELMEMSTRSANQTREVQTLKLQLQESGYRKDEMDRLRARVTELGDLLNGQKERKGSDVSSLEIENNDLRKKLRDIAAERQIAEDKLRDYVDDKRESKQVQVLRERNAALKHEVEKLTKKIKKLTESFRVESPRDQDTSNTKKHKSFEQDPPTVEATRFVI